MYLLFIFQTLQNVSCPSLQLAKTLRTFGHSTTIYLGPTPFLSALISKINLLFLFFRPYKMSAARQLQLAKRENFFSDPLFKDIWSFEDGDLQKRLETFKNKSALAIPGKVDTAHNLQVRISKIL